MITNNQIITIDGTRLAKFNDIKERNTPYLFFSPTNATNCTVYQHFTIANKVLGSSLNTPNSSIQAILADSSSIQVNQNYIFNVNSRINEINSYNSNQFVCAYSHCMPPVLSGFNLHGSQYGVLDIEYNWTKYNYDISKRNYTRWNPIDGTSYPVKNVYVFMESDLLPFSGNLEYLYFRFWDYTCGVNEYQLLNTFSRVYAENFSDQFAAEIQNYDDRGYNVIDYIHEYVKTTLTCTVDTSNGVKTHGRMRFMHHDTRPAITGYEWVNNQNVINTLRSKTFNVFVFVVINDEPDHVYSPYTDNYKSIPVKYCINPADTSANMVTGITYFPRMEIQIGGNITYEGIIDHNYLTGTTIRGYGFPFKISPPNATSLIGEIQLFLGDINEYA